MLQAKFTFYLSIWMKKLLVCILESIGAELTELSQDQAAYIGVEVSGPYKAETYRY